MTAFPQMSVPPTYYPQDYDEVLFRRHAMAGFVLDGWQDIVCNCITNIIHIYDIAGYEGELLRVAPNPRPGNEHKLMVYGHIDYEPGQLATSDIDAFQKYMLILMVLNERGASFDGDYILSNSSTFVAGITGSDELSIPLFMLRMSLHPVPFRF